MKPPDARTVNPGQAVTYTDRRGEWITDPERHAGATYEEDLFARRVLSVLASPAGQEAIRAALAEDTAPFAKPTSIEDVSVADEPRTAPIKRATSDPFGDY